jgi:hypothetical protein
VEIRECPLQIGGGKLVNDPVLADNFLSNNEEVNAWLRSSTYYGDVHLDNSEIKETVDYVDKIFANAKLKDEGTLYRGVSFRTEKELNDFIDTNIVFTGGVYKDKGFAFTNTGKVYDTYTGVYSVVFEYEGAKGLPHTALDKGWHSDVRIINRNTPFKVASVTKDGTKYHVKLTRM